MAATRNNNRFKIRNNDRGITLVEMIVVLVIMAILAASGIFTGVGYIKRSRFQKNEANAEIVYNAVQTALQQKEKAGTIDDWTKNLIGKGTPLASTGSNKPEQSSLDVSYNKEAFDDFPASGDKINNHIYMRYVLTYSSGNSSDPGDFLKSLIQPYFYDGTIFQGTITVEFLAEKSLDAYRNVHLSSTCLSVFVNSQAKTGWGAVVPSRSYADRKNTLVGYYEGYKGKTTDTVHLPQAQLVLRRFVAENVYVTVTPTPGPDDGEGSGEGNGNGTGQQPGEGNGSGEGSGEDTEVTEEKHIWLSWNATLDKANITGTKENKIYYKLQLLKGKDVVKELILNESFMHKGDDVGDSDHSKDYTALKDKSADESFEGYIVSEDKYPVEYGEDFSAEIIIKSITIDAQIFIKPSNGDFNYDGASPEMIKSNLHDIKLKISYVENEFNSDHTPKPAYYTFSIDVTDLLTSEIDGAKMMVYPNDFSNADMKEIINKAAYIPFKSGKSVKIDQEEEPSES